MRRLAHEVSRRAYLVENSQCLYSAVFSSSAGGLRFSDTNSGETCEHGRESSCVFAAALRQISAGSETAKVVREAVRCGKGRKNTFSHDQQCKPQMHVQGRSPSVADKQSSQKRAAPKTNAAPIESLKPLRPGNLHRPLLIA